jgi:transcriptional regulator with XRE-family HTH domain
MVVSYLSDLERGKAANPALRTLERFAAAYGLTVPELLRPVYPAEFQRLVDELPGGVMQDILHGG